jgi:hypothetical protein
MVSLLLFNKLMLHNGHTVVNNGLLSVMTCCYDATFDVRYSVIIMLEKNVQVPTSYGHTLCCNISTDSTEIVGWRHFLQLSYFAL